MVEKHEPPDWAKLLYIPAALAVICLLAYANSFRSGFVIDNDYGILRDPRLRAVTSENLGLIFSHGYWWLPPEKGLYRPFTTLTYLFNYAILGDTNQPAGYHWINLLLHYLNGLLVYGLALRFLKKLWPAGLVAALWAVHPVLTESVTNIFGRADLLAAAAVLSGFWMYLKSTETTGWRRIEWLAGLFLVTTIGMFSKESAIAILGVILLYELCWWKERKPLRGLLFGCAATGVPICGWLAARTAVMAHAMTPVYPFVDNPLVAASFWTATLTAIEVLGKYLWLLVWPANLSWNYYYAQIPFATGTPRDWIAWLAIAGVIVAAAMQFKRNRLYFFFAAFAFVTIFPVSNIVIKIGTIMADRFLYLPSVGFTFCIVMAIFAIGQRLNARMLAPVLLCGVVCVFTVWTLVRNADWRDNLTLLSADVHAAPNSFASHESLATELYLADPSHANIDQVLDEADKSLTILNPLPDSLNQADVYANAGAYYERKGDLISQSGTSVGTAGAEASWRAYKRSLDILLRGVSIDQWGDEDNRRKELARGKPDSEIPHVGSLLLYQQIALTYLRLGEGQKALEAASYARLLSPFAPETYLLMANIFFAQQRSDEGGRALVESYLISQDPGTLASVQAYLKSGVDPEGCGITQTVNGPILNNQCAPVHRLICLGSSDLVHSTFEAHRMDLADQTLPLEQFGCTKEEKK